MRRLLGKVPEQEERVMGTLDILLILFFVYLLLPVKHPCDYGSYK